jgi:hypothetical protein
MSDSGTESVSGDAEAGSGQEVDFREIIAPLSIAKFIDDVWAKKVWTSPLTDEVRDRLLGRFGRGETTEVLPRCRKDDNTTFTPEEMEQMNKDLEESRKTLNLPFCFCDGADDLRSTFIEACDGLGNDVEVGVYFSRPGGEVAPWHYDCNHNVTIQLCGQKDWQIVSGSPNTCGSNSMAETPKNNFDQQRLNPHIGQSTCYSLKPGSVIYLPPGHWHSVAAVGSVDSFSVDIRVGSVLHCKWICEALFTDLLDTFYTEQQSKLREVGPVDFGPTALSQGLRLQLAHIAENGARTLERCRLPRCFPFERSLTDGLHKAATLAYLHERGFVAPAAVVRAHGVVGVNRLVAVQLKLQDGCSLIVQLLSESSLTKMEYLRFSLHCDIALYAAASLLFSSKPEGRQLGETVCLAVLQSEAKVAGGAFASGQLLMLIRVLLHANVLYFVPQAKEQCNCACNRPAPFKRQKK